MRAASCTALGVPPMPTRSVVRAGSIGLEKYALIVASSGVLASKSLAQSAIRWRRDAADAASSSTAPTGYFSRHAAINWRASFGGTAAACAARSVSSDAVSVA